MKVSQIAEDLNIIFKEVIGTFEPDENGDLPLYKEDLSNFVDMGLKITKEAQNVDWDNNFDHYVGKLIDRIGYTIIVDKYLGDDGINIESNRYEYGAYLQKIRIKDIDFTDNEVWKLQKGEKYDYTEFNPVDMEATYFANKTTFGVEWSWVGKVLKESLTDLNKLMQLYAAIENRIMKKVRLMTREMKKRLINNMNGCNIKYGRQVNLLEEYITATGDSTITAATALTNKEFLLHTAMRLKMYKGFIADPTELLNSESELNWTPNDNFRMIALTDLDAALTAYLYSSTYHEEFVKLDGYSTISNWQGVTKGFPFDIRSSINVETTIPNGATRVEAKDNIATSGIVAVMFDKEAVTIWNEEPEMYTAPFNPKGKFINYFYSYDCNYYYDPAENSITFVISDYSPVTEEPADWGTGTYYTLNEGEYEAISTSAEWAEYTAAHLVYKKIA